MASLSDWELVVSQRDAAQDLVRELRYERDEALANYHGACKTIAAMHGAATGEPGSGPRRGIVEDVEDLRTERDAHRAVVTRLVAMVHRLKARVTRLEGELDDRE